VEISHETVHAEPVTLEDLQRLATDHEMHLALILQLCQTPAKVATHSSRPNHRNPSHSFHALRAAN
jgi:hypothetical protein